MYQKCPICEGARKVFTQETLTTNQIKCGTCNGTGIISSLTGLPPAQQPTDFRDHPSESQQEYFNK
jgi:DnaJ-class molecular chaperone